jgi:hypothetical protein
MDRLVITFDDLLRRTPFAETMRTLLKTLEFHFGTPVDTEFTAEVVDPHSIRPGVRITLLQCRPQSHLDDEEQISIPSAIPARDVILSTQRMVPRGKVEQIDYVLFVPPEGYFSLQTPIERAKLERAIGALNTALKEARFICVGPGRWGTSTPDLGVHIAYGDIYHTRALVELTGEGVGPDLEPSFGTHFFQDLMEAHIYPLAVTLGESGSAFNRKFFYNTRNRLSDFLPADELLLKCLRLIRVADFRAGHHLSLIMDDEQNKAVAFLQAD